MSRIYVSPIKTNEIILNNETSSGSIYTLENDLYFKDSQDTEYKLNQILEPIHIVNNNVGIATESPSAKLDIFSENTQLQLSYSSEIWAKLKINSSKCLDISGQSSININDSQLVNVKSPLSDNDGVNKKYVDDKLSCTTVDLLNGLCKIHEFEPSATTTDTEINEQITLRSQFKIPLLTMVFAVSSEYHPICVKNGLLTFRIPHNVFITEIRASLTKVAVGCSGIKFNIVQTESQCELLVSDFYIPPGHKSVSIKYGLDNGLYKVNQLVDNEELVVNVNQVGDIFSGTGLKITLIGL